MNIVIIILILAALAVIWWWLFGRNTPKYPPLEIKDDDPLMLEAINKAKSTVDELRRLYTEGNATDVQVKVPFLSSSETTEHLWAEVLEIQNEEIKVRYLTPPVTHKGKLERIHIHKISDIEDWAVFMKSGNIYGGFTQRVMFKRGREKWGSLPPELEKQESKYVAS